MNILTVLREGHLPNVLSLRCHRLSENLALVEEFLRMRRRPLRVKEASKVALKPSTGPA